jgi:serine/threonine-protein kinase
VYRIGRYQIVEELGRGSMGVVYLAVDPRIGRKVALKTIRLPDGLSPTEVAQYRERFRREGMAAGKINHPHIVTIHDVGDDAETGASFIVMEYVEGVTLRDRIQTGGPMPEPEVRRLGMQLAEAVEFAHQQGIIHRDIKPANVLVTSSGDAKIMDFGIARLADSDLTQDEQAIGSPAYMSPEQIRGERIGKTSDYFSLGVVLYHLATGRKPFEGRDTASVMYRILNEEPLPPSEVPALKKRRRRGANGALSADFDRIIAKLLRKKPSKRYSSCGDLIRDLSRTPTGDPAAPVPKSKRKRKRKRAAATGRPRLFPATEVFLGLTGIVLLVGIVLFWGLRSGGAAPMASQTDPAATNGDSSTTSPFWKDMFSGSEDDRMATLEIRFPHHLSKGSLTVWMDGDEILHRKLRTETTSRKLFGKWKLEKPDGLVSEMLTVEPGSHHFEALVKSPDDDLAVRGDRILDLPGGAAGRLMIDLDRLFGERLDLKWK